MNTIRHALVSILIIVVASSISLFVQGKVNANSDSSAISDPSSSTLLGKEALIQHLEELKSSGYSQQELADIYLFQYQEFWMLVYKKAQLGNYNPLKKDFHLVHDILLKRLLLIEMSLNNPLLSNLLREISIKDADFERAQKLTDEQFSRVMAEVKSGIKNTAAERKARMKRFEKWWADAWADYALRVYNAIRRDFNKYDKAYLEKITSAVSSTSLSLNVISDSEDISELSSDVNLSNRLSELSEADTLDVYTDQGFEQRTREQYMQSLQDDLDKYLLNQEVLRGKIIDNIKSEHQQKADDYYEEHLGQTYGFVDYYKAIGESIWANLPDEVYSKFAGDNDYQSAAISNHELLKTDAGYNHSDMIALRNYIDTVSQGSTFIDCEGLVYDKVESFMIQDQSVQLKESSVIPGTKWIVLDALDDGRSVCRTVSPVLEQGLEYLAYKTNTSVVVDQVTNGEHVWVRVSQEGGSSYDLDPHQLRTYIQLPTRNVLSEQVIKMDYDFSESQ